MGIGNPFCMQYDHTSQRARERKGGGGRERERGGGGRERERGRGRKRGGGGRKRERERTRKPGRKAKIVDESGLQNQKNRKQIHWRILTLDLHGNISPSRAYLHCGGRRRMPSTQPSDYKASEAEP